MAANSSNSNIPGPARGLWGRLRNSAKRRTSSARRAPRISFRSIVILGLGMIVTIALGITYGLVSAFFLASPPERQLPTPEMALAALDAERFAEARWLAGQIRQAPDVSQDALGLSAYVLGKVMYYSAAEKFNYAEQRTRYLLSARYFEEAERLGVLGERRPDLLEHLGNALYFAERWAQAQAPLRRALEMPIANKTRLHRRLANALLQDQKGSAAEAAEQIAAFLADPKLNARERLEGLIELAEIRMKLGDFAGCLETVGAIPADAPEHARALVLRGRLELEQADAMRRNAGDELEDEAVRRVIEHRRAALTLFQEAEQSAGSDARAEQQAMYFHGRAQRLLGEYGLAEEQFRKTRRLHFNSPEGLAAQLEEAEIQLEARRFEDSVRAYESLLVHVDDPNQYSNLWVPLEELRRRIELAFGRFRAEAKFAELIRLAESLKSLFPESLTVELAAEAHELLAEQEFRRAGQAPAAEREKLAAEARVHAREAGALYAHLADLRRGDKANPAYLSKSADNYLRGQDFRSAAQVLAIYQQTQPRKLHVPILLRIAEVQSSLGNLDEAIRACEECLQFYPRDPMTFRARLIASRARHELGDAAGARKLLLQNLEHENLTPESIEWRDSLFALGRILYHEGLELETKSRLSGVDSDDLDVRKAALKDLEAAVERYQESARRLEEAITRFPTDTQAMEAGYLLAECQRRSASLPRRRLPTVTIETSRLALNRQAQEFLNEAARRYRDLLEAFPQRETTELDDFERAIRRNAHFALADTLFDLGRYEEALRAYAQATHQYANSPEALEAFLQIAVCHARLNRRGDAAGAIEQAKSALERIPAEVDTTSTTRFDRGQWKQYLDWLGAVYKS